MTQSIEYFYDFRSAYSYMAYTQLSQMDVSVVFRPIEIPKLMELVGNVPTVISCPTKGRHARVDVMRWARRYGVPLNPSDVRTMDGEACLRAVLAATSSKEAAAITMALYRAIWTEGKSLANRADILATIAAAGLNVRPVADRIDSEEVAARLNANTAEAAKRGVFGAPTMFVGEAMFFGNDRLDFVREELARLNEAA